MMYVIARRPATSTTTTIEIIFNRPSSAVASFHLVHVKVDKISSEWLLLVSCGQRVSAGRDVFSALGSSSRLFGALSRVNWNKGNYHGNIGYRSAIDCTYPPAATYRGCPCLLTCCDCAAAASCSFVSWGPDLGTTRPTRPGRKYLQLM